MPQNPERKLRPIAQMPIWARLKFAEMIPNTYYTSEDKRNPLSVRNAIIQGFERKGDTVWIFWIMNWKKPSQVSNYIWPAVKSGREEDVEY